MTDTSMKDVLDPTGTSPTLVGAAETVVSRIAAIEGAKGAANGLAALNSSGKLAQTVDGANVNQDSTHRFATDTEKTYWNAKLDAPTIHSATEKTIPADADEIGIVDSAASNALKRLTWANLKATLYAQLANVASGFIGIIYVDTWANCLANKPPASNSGKFYLVTDRYNGALYRSNGTCLDRVGGGPIVSDTASNINANYDPTTYDGCVAIATDLGVPGVGIELIAAGGRWRVKSPGIVNLATAKLVPSNWYINCNPSGGTYSQSGTTLTLTWTSHGIPNNLNGANIYLAPSSGTATSGWYSNIAVVDANTITCTASASRSTSGNIGSNSVETYLPTLITFPSFLIRAGVVVNLSGFHWAKAGASTKTTKLYSFGNSMGSVNLTTSGQIAVVGQQPYGQGLRFSTDTNFYFNTLTSILNYTVTDMTFKFSSTCATANDWHAICTEWITYSGA